jgi:hypothetical protein
MMLQDRHAADLDHGLGLTWVSSSRLPSPPARITVRIVPPAFGALHEDGTDRVRP